MANVPALLTTLVQRLRAALPAEGRSASAVTDALADDDLRTLAHEVLQAERKAYGAVDAPDAEAWDSVAAALSQALEGDPTAAPNVARESLTKRLKALAADSRRRWVVVLPVGAEMDPDAATTDVLSTAESVRVVAAPCASAAEVTDRLRRAFDSCGASASALPTLTPPTPALFVTTVVGSDAPAIRQGMRKLAIGRDALRFAVHIHGGDLGPLHQGAPSSPLSDVWLIEQPGKAVLARVARLGDVAFGSTISALADPKTRKTFDAAARMLEGCPEGGRDRAELAWRLSRSIRVFSRAVVEANRDLRFLLLLVAFEAVLSRKDSAIAESLAEVGALVATTTVEERVNLARALKRAYDIRSRFVHAGQIPSERLGEAELAQAEGVVFRAWIVVMRRLLPLTDATVTDDALFDGLVRLKFGAGWSEAFAVRGEPKAPETQHE